jgi:excisionase family DNA binding protein
MKSSTTRMSEIREVMDIRQASDYLGISPDTLYKYASESFIPAFKLGNRWRFKKSRLDEWMDLQSGPRAQAVPAQAAPAIDASVTAPADPVQKSVRPRQKKPVRSTRSGGRRVALKIS